MKAPTPTSDSTPETGQVSGQLVKLNTTGRCDHCNGIVKNISHKRHPLDRLVGIHEDSCPGIRKRSSK